jgi:hypothetical protein
VHGICAQYTPHWWRDISLPPDEWYLICFTFPYQKGEISVYINTSSGDPMFFTPTEGSTSFMYENEDFHGTLVYKQFIEKEQFMNPFLFKSIVVNGKKEVIINNTFVGTFYSHFGRGRAHLQYTTPEGKTMGATVWGKFGDSWEGDFFPPLHIILGGEGTWEFEANQVGIWGFYPDCVFPLIGLLGADITLP